MNHPTPNSELLQLAPLRLLVRNASTFSGPNPRNARPIDNGFKQRNLTSGDTDAGSPSNTLSNAVLSFQFLNSIDFSSPPATKHDSHIWN